MYCLTNAGHLPERLVGRVVSCTASLERFWPECPLEHSSAAPSCSLAPSVSSGGHLPRY